MKELIKFLLVTALLSFGLYKLIMNTLFNGWDDKLEIGVWYYAIPEQNYDPFIAQSADTTFIMILERKGGWVKYKERAYKYSTYTFPEAPLMMTFKGRLRKVNK